MGQVKVLPEKQGLTHHTKELNLNTTDPDSRAECDAQCVL